MPDTHHPPMPRRALITGTITLAVLDIVSKYAAFAALGEPQQNPASPHGFPVIDGFFYFTTRYNTGFSWSWFSGIPWLLSAFINILILGAVGYMLFFTRHIPVNRWTIAAGMLIMGGACGNLYDRLVHQAVRDFIDFVIPIINYNYPVFNLADVFIVAGVIVAVAEPYLSGRSRAGDAAHG